jgi:hypothetical protein
MWAVFLEVAGDWKEYRSESKMDERESSCVE